MERIIDQSQVPGVTGSPTGQDETSTPAGPPPPLEQQAMQWPPERESQERAIREGMASVSPESTMYSVTQPLSPLTPPSTGNEALATSITSVLQRPDSHPTDPPPWLTSQIALLPLLSVF